MQSFPCSNLSLDIIAWICFLSNINHIEETVDVKYLKILKPWRFQNSTSIMCSTCLILVTVIVISWRKPRDSSQKSLSCKTDVFNGKTVKSHWNIGIRHIFVTKFSYGIRNVGRDGHGLKWPVTIFTGQLWKLYLHSLQKIYLMSFFSNGGRT